MRHSSFTPGGNDWKKIDNTKWGEGLSKLSSLHTAGGNVKMATGKLYKVC